MTLELGAMDYFTKPITPEQMKVIIPLKANNALKFYEQRKHLKDINQRMKNELKIAGMLQSSLIRSKDNYNRMKVYQRYIACDELGGDLFDYVESPERDWFMIADITGHGVAASLVASMLKVSFNHAIVSNNDPASVLNEINMTFYHLMLGNTNLCFSVFVGAIEENRIIFSNAGHPYPIVIRPQVEKWEMLSANGYLIGLFDDASYENHSADFFPGDAIFMYTDGLFEDPRNPEASKSHNSVLEHGMMIESHALSNPDLFLEQMLASFGKANKNQIDDDIAIMYLIRKNQPADAVMT